MRPVDAAFLRLVRGSHRMCARARIVSDFQVGVDPDGVEIPILGGDVQLDANADIRATVDLSTDGNGTWPTTTAGSFAPYGNELFIERGVELGDGGRVWVSQGYFRLYDTEQNEVPNGQIRLAGRDRMSGIVDGRLLAPIQFSAGTSVELVFEVLVGEIYPDATILFDFPASGTLFTTAHIAEEDRYDFLLDVTRSLGKIMYWDHEGKLRVESPPDPADPVFDVDAGANGVLVRMSRSLSRDGVYNAVVASGEAPGEEIPVRAVARDTNPQSPTFWDGSFGKVPRFYSSPFISTQEQAATAAVAMLTKSLGLPYNVDLTAVPNPALEPLDPVRVKHVDGEETHVLERLTIPLTAREPLTATTREQTIIQIGVD